MLYGIDVSSNQSADVCARAQHDFAIVKMSGNPHGYAWNYVNPSAKRQADDAYKKHGRVGFYHFAYGMQASTEAKFFVEQVDKLGYLRRAVLALDYEADAVSKGSTWVKKFCERVKELAGYQPIVYASGSVIVEQNLFSLGYPIWCANYSKGYSRIDGYTTKGCSIYGGCERSLLWQYTSSGYVDGYAGPLDCNVFYGGDADWRALAGMSTKQEATMTDYIDVADVAATIHADMCEDAANGYSWDPRWGEDGLGVKKLNIGGRTYQYDRGSYDCASSVITACNEALRYTKHKDALKAATYTGNIRSVFNASGLFDIWKTSTTVAKRGDVYLNDASHTAMCQSDVPDMLSEFSINEKGGTYGGKVGDQTGREAWIHEWYDYPWNVTLHWKSAKLAAASTATKASTSTKSSTKLTVDGVLGKLTISELQRQLGVKASGKMDAATVKALQKALNAGTVAKGK